MADYDQNRGYGRDRYRGSYDGYDLNLFQHAGFCIEPQTLLFDVVLLFTPIVSTYAHTSRLP